MSDIINWLLEDDNPAVKYRTQTEILGKRGDRSSVKPWVLGNFPENWQQTNGLWYRYYITALAECGLTYQEIPSEMLEKAFASLMRSLNMAAVIFCF